MSNKDIKKLNFVYDDDLEKTLKQLNVFDDFITGKKKCKFCERIIDRENLHSLFREFENIQFICDSPRCVKELIIYIK